MLTESIFIYTWVEGPIKPITRLCHRADSNACLERKDLRRGLVQPPVVHLDGFYFGLMMANAPFVPKAICK
jgi:hypothetical protein